MNSTSTMITSHQTATSIDLPRMGRGAREAGRALARVTTTQKNAALHAIADGLIAHEAEILQANAHDMDAARAAGLSDALLDRLSLAGRVSALARDCRAVADLPDPVGEIIEQSTLDNGLRLARKRTPIGVIGVIYEARPNVTVDVATLTLKTGNAAILRGGSETIHSNTALARVIRAALAETGLPADAVSFIEDTDRRYVGELLRLHEYIDMIIPRGGAGLHKFCRENSTIPVITGGIGVCHLFVDVGADLEKSLAVIHNAKTQRPSVCNALDTLLVHERVAAELLPRLAAHLRPAGVAFRLDPRAAEALKAGVGLLPAGPDDWDTEWMSLVLGIRVVSGLDEAIAHIHAHSTGHSDGILTSDAANAARFVDEIDSAAVFVNASTRFNDGGQFGLGAEIAVSTQKLHARGPMGLRELTTYKWVVQGDYHTRA